MKAEYVVLEGVHFMLVMTLLHRSSRLALDLKSKSGEKDTRVTHAGLRVEDSNTNFAKP